MQRKKAMEWRRNQVLELSSKGLTQSDIARTLQVNVSTICRDIYFLTQQSKENIRKYIDERLPAEYERCLVGLTSILKEAWITAAKTEDKREKLQALSLAKECCPCLLVCILSASSGSIDKDICFSQFNVRLAWVICISHLIAFSSPLFPDVYHLRNANF